MVMVHIGNLNDEFYTRQWVVVSQYSPLEEKSSELSNDPYVLDSVVESRELTFRNKIVLRAYDFKLCVLRDKIYKQSSV